jgi:hypothetical protein
MIHRCQDKERRFCTYWFGVFETSRADVIIGILTIWHILVV